MPVDETDVQISNNIPGFQAIEMVYPTFKMIIFYRSPSQDPENITKVRDYFSNKTDPDYIIIGNLNIPGVMWGKNGLNTVPSYVTHAEEKQVP